MTPPQSFSHWPSWPLPVLRDVAVTEPHACSYLPGRLAMFRAFEAEHMAPAEFQRWLDAGFRRSGTFVYQPMCIGCRDCIPIRVPTLTFVPSRSQRRVLRRNADLTVTVGAPCPTAEKWSLYQRYQRHWHEGTQSDDLPAFLDFLCRSPVECLEFEYRDPAGHLLGVGLCDLCPSALSTVYFYFDPDHARRSLGTYSALHEIDWARQRGLTHWYAGYWVAACRKMSYKSRFRPCEILGTDGLWRPLAPDVALP